MASKGTKMTNVKVNFIEKTNSNSIFGQNNIDDAECGGLDSEIKNIFDDLRLVGSPRNYSLNEVLVKAIAAEKELMRGKAKTSNKNLSYSKFENDIKNHIWQICKVWERKFQQLQFQAIIAVLLLSLGVVRIMSMLPSSVQANSSPLFSKSLRISDVTIISSSK